MGLDKIIVLVLMVLFFGGIALLAWNSRRAEKLKGMTTGSSSMPIKRSSEENPHEGKRIDDRAGETFPYPRIK
jgi:hypothetical protein